MLPPHYDGAADPQEFLRLYAQAIRAAGGDYKAIANCLPLALTEMPRSWLRGLPEASVSSWEELCGQFIARFAPPGPHTVASILGGS